MAFFYDFEKNLKKGFKSLATTRIFEESEMCFKSRSKNLNHLKSYLFIFCCFFGQYLV